MYPNLISVAVVLSEQNPDGGTPIEYANKKRKRALTGVNITLRGLVGRDDQKRHALASLVFGRDVYSLNELLVGEVLAFNRLVQIDPDFIIYLESVKESL